MSTLRFHGMANERARLKEALRSGEIKQPQVIFTTYETFVAEESWFKSQRWTYCVLDEGHKIKNADTNISGKLQGLGCLHRLSKNSCRCRLVLLTKSNVNSLDRNTGSKQPSRIVVASPLAVSQRVYRRFRALI